jgi:hypothetical protein
MIRRRRRRYFSLMKELTIGKMFTLPVIKRDLVVNKKLVCHKKKDSIISFFPMKEANFRAG